MVYEREEIPTPVRPRKRKLSNQDWRDIQAAHAAGATQATLAAQYGVGYWAISRVLGKRP